MKAATMTDELSDFVTKFHNLLNAGKTACIVMECENGQAYVNLEVELGHGHPNQPCREQHFCRGRRAGPSRLRRRERRDMARLTAAQAGASAMQAGPPPHHEAAHNLPPLRAEEVAHFHPSHTVEEAAHHNRPHTADQAAHHHPPLRAEEDAHYQRPHTVAEVAPHLPSHRAEQVAHHYHPSCSVEEAALHQTPCPVQGGLQVGRAAEYFPPLSYTPKEVFLPAAAPLQVSPVWPAHYQEDDDASPHLRHHLTFPPLLTPSVAVRTPAGQHYAGQGELHSDAKKKSGKKKRKNRGTKDEAELDEVIVTGGPGTPTVVMKGWGALEALIQSSKSK